MSDIFTLRELLDDLDGDGLIITNEDIVNAALVKRWGFTLDTSLDLPDTDLRNVTRTQHCGWGAEHDAHQHPGMDNTTCPGGEGN